MKSHIAVTAAPLSEYARQQPVDETHLGHCDQGVRGQRTDAGSTSLEVVMGKADQRPACGKQSWLSPFFDVLLHIRPLLQGILPPCGQPLRYPQLPLRPSGEVWFSHRPLRKRLGWKSLWFQLQQHNRRYPAPTGLLPDRLRAFCRC